MKRGVMPTLDPYRTLDVRSSRRRRSPMALLWAGMLFIIAVMVLMSVSP